MMNIFKKTISENIGTFIASVITVVGLLYFVYFVSDSDFAPINYEMLAIAGLIIASWILYPIYLSFRALTRNPKN